MTLQNGSYIVELFFAEIDSFPFEGNRVFDVLLEGQTVLTDYDIYADRSKIASFDVDELDAAQAFSNTGTVKRFAVDVRGGDGLQIDLVSETFNTDPILSAVRILDAGPARIEDIILVLETLCGVRSIAGSDVKENLISNSL